MSLTNNACVPQIVGRLKLPRFMGSRMPIHPIVFVAAVVSRPVSGRVYPGKRPISTRYAIHASCSGSLGQHPMIRHDPWQSRFVPDINTSGRPQRRAHSLSAWSLGRARCVPVFGRVGPPRRRVCCALGPARTVGLDAISDAQTGGVRPPPGRRLRLPRQIGDQLVAGVEQFLLVNDVVAVEDGPALVAGQEHGDPLGHTGADQIAGGGAAAVVKRPSVST